MSEHDAGDNAPVSPGIGEALFGKLLEATPDATLVLHENGAIAFVNSQAEALFGYGRDDLLGEPVEMLLPERYRQRHMGLRAAYLANPRVRPMGAGLDLYARTRDGAEIPVEISLSPLATEQELLVLCAIRDVSERKRMEAELDRHRKKLEELVEARTKQLRDALRDLDASYRELSYFAHAASHDLKEPLRMVTSYTELLAKRYGEQLDDKAHRYIRYASDGAQRMVQIIDDLLTYSRSPNAMMSPQPVPLDAVIRTAEANLARLIEETDAEIVKVDLPTVLGERSPLVLVFQNFIANSIKFRTPGERPRITIRAEQDNRDWLVSVVDNGIGIDPQYAKVIFEPFRRLHTKEEYPGTGMGLAIAAKIIRAHGGEVWASTLPDHGLTVKLTLPMVDPPPPTNPPLSRPPATG